MKLIRNSVFETNSSSCHSLSIDENCTDFVSLTPDYDGVIRVSGGDFGWNEETYENASSKLAYVLIYIRDWVKPKGRAENFNQILQKLIKEHTGADSAELYDKNDGYIDHQSVEGGDLNYLFEEQNLHLLKSFIFGTTSSLRTDNDNH